MVWLPARRARRGNNVAYTAVYKTRPTSTAATESGSVTFNNWHRHNYFPLYNNSCVSVNGHTPLDAMINSVSGLTTTDFGSYTQRDGTTAATLTLKGVKLNAPKNTSGGNSVLPDDYLFGYFDCHPNGLRSGAQVNPYDTGRTGNDNSNGDPIDISWAVEADGTPANLDAIRYVRCYTGVMQMNGAMGESSSELLGSHKATTKGTGAASTTPTIRQGLLPVATENMKSVSVAAGAYTITSSATNILVNGVPVSTGYSLTVVSGGVYQIITQNGTESPYITVLTCA